jgi:hypothetical protein
MIAFVFPAKIARNEQECNGNGRKTTSLAVVDKNFF